MRRGLVVSKLGSEEADNSSTEGQSDVVRQRPHRNIRKVLFDLEEARLESSSDPESSLVRLQTAPLGQRSPQLCPEGQGLSLHSG
jgi:hypothetical protein